MESEDTPAETSLDAGGSSVARRKILKATAAALSVVATVRSQPAWAGYASLQSNYGTTTTPTTGG